MAEQAPPARNTTLLLIALLLGGVVVAIYLFNIRQVRRSSRGQTKYVLVFRRTIPAGDAIEEKDLEIRRIETQYADSLGDVVTGDTERLVDGYRPAKGSVLQQDVSRDQWLRWSHITGLSGKAPSHAIRKGREAFTLAIDPRTAPGTILSVDDRVVLIGKISVKGRPLKSYRILEGVRVLAIGGVAGHAQEKTRRRSSLTRRGQRSYRSLTLEVTQEIAEQLDAVLSHVQGSVRVTVLSPNSDPLPPARELQIHKDLRSLHATVRRMRGPVLQKTPS